MKKIFISCLLFFAPWTSFSQNTWVQKLNDFSGFAYLHADDLVTGVKDIAISADGNIYLLAKLDQDSKEGVFKISRLGHPIFWSINAGYHATMSGSYTTRIKATSDSGFIMMHNFMSYSTWYHVDGYIEKYNNDGSSEWSVQFPANPNNERIAYDAIQRSNGGYWALVDNMSFKFDENGNLIDSSYIVGTKLYEMPNGDLIVQNNDIYRTDTLGNIIWTTQASANDAFVVSSSLPYFFLTSGSSVKKISAVDGSLMWVKNYSTITLSSIDITPGGGFIASSGIVPTDFFPSNGGPTHSIIICADSSGDTLWTRETYFPYYGISAIKSFPDGKIILGGAYLIGLADPFSFSYDYKVFCAMLDSSGHGELDHTDYMWPGDANNNQLLSFVDDALYMVIANGDTGPGRDTIDMFNCCGIYGLKSDFAFDWTNSFGNGTNHKYADFDGNGLVDTNDITLFQLLSLQLPDSITIPAPFRFQNLQENSSTLPDFKLVPDRDTISPGDDIHFYMIAGSQVNPVDSIYGLAFSFFPTITSVSVNSTTLIDCDLGTIGSNLFTMDFKNNFYGPKSLALTCRYDHQNAINLFDTLGVITVSASAAISSPTSFELHISDFKAIRWDESLIPFNLVSGTVVVDPAYVSVNENSETSIKIYPNPASDILSVATGNTSQKKIEIINSTGQKVKSLVTSDKTISVSSEDLPGGVYNLSVTTNQYTRHFPVVIQH